MKLNPHGDAESIEPIRSDPLQQGSQLCFDVTRGQSDYRLNGEGSGGSRRCVVAIGVATRSAGMRRRQSSAIGKE